ncbi:MAG: hypothetical protein Q4C60_09590 [Eubacteriales bacterium]|nr:hypothetical protein [Eubacteriales bacterium]
MNEEERVTQTGWCRYCGSSLLIEVLPRTPQEELNDIATQECDCDQAQYAREREGKIRRAQITVKNLSASEPAAGGILERCIEPLIDREIKKVSINVNGRVTYTLYRGGEDELNAQRKETITDEEVCE